MEKNSYLCNLYLKGCLWVAEMSAIMFDSLISAVKAIPTPVAMPVSSFEFFGSFDSTNNITVIAAPQYLKTYKKTTHKIEF